MRRFLLVAIAVLWTFLPACDGGSGLSSPDGGETSDAGTPDGSGGADGSSDSGIDAGSDGGVRQTPPVPLPVTGAYFGAWVNPSGVSANEEPETEALEAQVGRRLALHMHYYGWNSTFPDQAMADDATFGRIPVLTWNCGDGNPAVAAGADDGVIQARALALQAYGRPVFLRWNWEMNLAPDTLPDGGHTDKKCLRDAGSAGYVAAWQHIYTVFRDAGTTNVAFLWNPSGGQMAPDPMPFYPGSDYVDWIGFDGYDRNISPTFDFGDVFSPFYEKFKLEGRPFLIGETGECPGEQSHYLDSARSEMEGRSNPKNYSFPLLKGFMYFDAAGQAFCPWNFDQDGGVSFAAMGSDPYFSPTF